MPERSKMKKTKTKPLSVRLSDIETGILKKASRIEKVDLSAFIRESALEKATGIIFAFNARNE